MWIRIIDKEGYNGGLTIKTKGQKFSTNSHDETLKLLEKLEIHLWGSSGYSD